VKINQLDNYERKAYGYLPKIQVTGMTDPVVQVIDGENGEVLYKLRIRGTSFQPWVFKDGIYRVNVGELGTDWVKFLRDLRPDSISCRTVLGIRGLKFGILFNSPRFKGRS